MKDDKNKDCIGLREKLKMPIGIEDFEKLRKEGFYYVDKTEMIIELLANWGEVNLFTRPRRFGKSLNMSMLKNFFEIGTDKSIFDGLRVLEDKAVCEKYMGKYPVVSISLKGVNGMNFEEAYDVLCSVIRKEAGRFGFLQDSSKLSYKEKKAIDVLTDPKIAVDVVKDSLSILTAALEKHYGQKVILLIDEYDVPLDKAYANGYYPQMVSLIRGMFDAALKSNGSLYFAVLTGCLRVSKESIFTGLNNLIVHSISDEGFDEYFGFTDEEVRKMLSDYGLEAYYAETREWYDGYLFGGQYVYCPWDVISYCYDLLKSTRPRPKSYWLNTSGNDMVRELIKKTSGTGVVRREIEQLIAGETVTKKLNEQLTHSEIYDNIENIWSLLYMTGYLTIADYPDGDMYKLRIPNREILEIYKKQVLSWFNDRLGTEKEKLTELYNAFKACDTPKIEELICKQIRTTVSFHDAYETFYHGFMLALLNNCASWVVISNRETGNGRSDIIVESDEDFGFVIELKVVKEKNKLETACSEAIGQIESRNYADALRYENIEDITAYGIAFCDKSCVVRAKKLEA